MSGVQSFSRLVCSGVPQGSVLSLLLFLVYINHLPSYIRTKCKFFADDLKIYMKIRHDSFVSLAHAREILTLSTGWHTPGV